MTGGSAETIVFGAGIAGASLAYHLARAGVGPVVVVDPRTPAAGATGRAAGIVTEQLWNRWDVAVVRETAAEYADLARRRDPAAYRVNGFVRWTSRADVARVLCGVGERLRSWGVDVRPLAPSEVAERLPWVRADDLAAAAIAPGDAVVAPSRLAELYVEEARSLGVEFLLGARVEGPVLEQDRWTVNAGGSRHRARRVIVAAGAWSKRLLTAARAPLPLAPYRTQAALLRPSGGGTPDFPSFHDIDLDVYARPEEAGRVLVGDGTESVETDPETFATAGDERFLAHVAESFESRVPGWKDADLLRAWAGVCVATPDRRPFVGPVPSAHELYALTGFNGFGVMRAAGAARRLASVIADPSREEAELGPVRPARFPAPHAPFAPKPGFTLEDGPDPRF